LFSVYSDFQEENAKLRRENAELESALNEKGAVASLAGSKLAAVEAHSKIALAEAQVQLVHHSCRPLFELVDLVLIKLSL
jgi:cell division septum initiation protein DivIVA